MEPQCPAEHPILDKTTCLCTKSAKSLPRCPKGTRRDRKTLKCVPSPAKRTFRVPTPPKKTARVTRKINRSGEKRTTVKKTRKKLIVVSTPTPPGDKAISKAVAALVGDKIIAPTVTPLTKAQQNAVMAEVRGELIAQKSYSPAVNARLVTMRPADRTSIFGCGIEDELVQRPAKAARAKKGLMVKVGVDSKGEPVCVSWNTKRARQVLLDNLRTEGAIDCQKVVAPMQALSNCWFNTMFMTFFVSDKGRKFFRYFRQLMIEGKLANGAKIKPPRLAEAFFLFNAAVEASINPAGGEGETLLAQLMNTNNLISAIYAGMPREARKAYPAIRGIDEANNPLAYYTDIVNYLYGGSQRMEFMGGGDILILRVSMNQLRDMIAQGRTASLPDVIVLVVHDDNVDAKPGEQRPGDSGKFSNKPTSFVIKPTKQSKSLKGSKYVLDSAVVRDTEAVHFCSTLTCSGKGMGFDGESFSRVADLDWKPLINKDKEWTFEGSVWQGTKKQIKWNFRNGYQLLFYYRTS